MNRYLKRWELNVVYIIGALLLVNIIVSLFVSVYTLTTTAFAPAPVVTYETVLWPHDEGYLPGDVVEYTLKINITENTLVERVDRWLEDSAGFTVPDSIDSLPGVDRPLRQDTIFQIRYSYPIPPHACGELVLYHGAAGLASAGVSDPMPIFVKC